MCIRDRAQNLAKRAIDLGLEGTLAEGLSLEQDLFAEAFATEDARTGVQFFLEHGPGRPPLPPAERSAADGVRVPGGNGVPPRVLAPRPDPISSGIGESWRCVASATTCHSPPMVARAASTR